MNAPINFRDSLNKRAKDYTFAIFFLLLFSFFIFFIIRPNLVTGFGLQKELTDLQKLDKDYEQAIFNIVQVQAAVERNRDLFPLLNEAVPATPQVNQVLDDIKKVASESGIDLKKVDINQISLKESKTKTTIKPYDVAIETQSEFAQVSQFLDKLLKQRRLKSIKTLSIIKEGKEGSGSAQLRIKLEIEGFYL